MIGWVIVGGLALLALRQNKTVPQVGGAVVMKPVYRPVAVLPHGPVAQSFAGNEAILPGKPVAPQFSVPTSVPGVNFNPQYVNSAAITKAADAQAGASVAANLQIAVAVDKASGSYTGYGVPLSGPGMFAPLPFNESGFQIGSNIGEFAGVDATTLGFSGGPLAG